MICPGVTIGNRCVIGAGSVVTKDIESDSVAVGNPARVIKRSVTVRRAVKSDLDSIMEIFEYAKSRMRQSGNLTQWADGYPNTEAVLKDIADGTGYVIESSKGIIGVFAFIIGEDPNYAEIDGQWPDNEPYGTIHRIAAAPEAHGIADIALDHCLRAGINIRIDTHADNAPMLGWIAKRGFAYCGIVRVADGTPRKAFQLHAGPKAD